ncbi:MAG: FkbM family methyltransferase [Bacteroidota bacterium]|nr:FkbM family methyltransferase [Bacteroidota bacterium]
MKRLIKKIFPQSVYAVLGSIKDRYRSHYSMRTYSQEGEDAVLRKIFENKESGFYVDVGSHHPWRFSNTQIFYEQGWRGINIDAMPGSMKPFQRHRTQDINLEIAISDVNEKLTYYVFNEPALNGFSDSLSQLRNNLDSFRIIATKEIATQTLKDIFDQYLPAHQIIDFLSVDVEGFDFRVLNSNDWVKYRPLVILVEVLDMQFKKLYEDKIVQFLTQKGYEVFGKTGYTVIFKEQSFQ